MINIKTWTKTNRIRRTSIKVWMETNNQTNKYEAADENGHNQTNKYESMDRKENTALTALGLEHANKRIERIALESKTLPLGPANK